MLDYALKITKRKIQKRVRKRNKTNQARRLEILPGLAGIWYRDSHRPQLLHGTEDFLWLEGQPGVDKVPPDFGLARVPLLLGQFVSVTELLDIPDLEDVGGATTRCLKIVL